MSGEINLSEKGSSQDYKPCNTCDNRPSAIQVVVHTLYMDRSGVEARSASQILDHQFIL